MAKNPESDRESDTRPWFNRGIPKLTGYGDGGGDSPILKSGYGGGDEDNSTQVPETPNISPNLPDDNTNIVEETGMWTSSNQKKGFMAIMGHFIDNDWILQSKILRFLYVPCPHTSEVLTNVLMDALMEWNVDTKLSTITVDNCTTNDSLIGKIKDKLQLNKLIHDGSHIHMRCSAHILNLIVKIRLNVIKVAIENIRESVSYWAATPKRVEKFEETCRQLKVIFSKRLGLDCQTRWNATYLMLKTALMYKDVFARLKQRDSQYKTLPS
ncbi:zinc finger BED domain-containing protein RICESLEEPER 2-like protein, partial [Tanacetum coccineum]